MRHLFKVLFCLLPCALKAATPAYSTQGSTYYQVHQPYAMLNCSMPSNLATNQSASTSKSATVDCLNQQLRDSEQKLDQLINALKQQLKNAPNKANPSGTWLTPPNVLLEQAQTDWQIFRDSQCAFETLSSVGQPSYQNHLNICRLSYTRERIDYLRWFLAQAAK